MLQLPTAPLAHLTPRPWGGWCHCDSQQEAAEHITSRCCLPIPEFCTPVTHQLHHPELRVTVSLALCKTKHPSFASL